MAWSGLSILAVVPARGGSKGIPRKNLCRIGGLSLIAHAARVLKPLAWVDRAVLSTDDQDMAEEGKRHGLDVPFMRPAALSQDLSTSVDMWRHAWLASEKHFDRRFDISILLQPTTPLRTPEEVEQTLTTMIEGGHQAATTVSRVPAHFTPEKILRMEDSGILGYYHPHGAEHTARQTIPPYFFRNGLCYAVTRQTLIDYGQIIEENCVGVVIDRFVVNIDDPEDLDLAEFYYARTPDLFSC
jgi:CMP-N-acetylneuraminic acid synthetase